MIMETKICKKCGRTLPKTEFYIMHGSLTSPCKDCIRRAKREYMRKKRGGKAEIETQTQPQQPRKRRRVERAPLMRPEARPASEQRALDACREMHPFCGNYFQLGFIKGAAWAASQKGGQR